MKLDYTTDTGLDAKGTVVKKITSILGKMLRKIGKKKMKFRVITATLSITRVCKAFRGVGSRKESIQKQYLGKRESKDQAYGKMERHSVEAHLLKGLQRKWCP